MPKKIQTLTKGHYLAPIYQTHDFGDILVGMTKYACPVQTGIWHIHERPMISLVLYGGNVESRKSKEIERTNGCINYYHAHEIHKNDYKVFPSIHISLEVEQTFLKKHNYNELDVELAVRKSIDPQFTFLQLLKEAATGDLQSAASIEMSFLSFLDNALETKEDVSFPRWMVKVRDILHDRWNENMSLAALAEQANIHPVTISKYFRRYFGCTLGEYMRKLKVKQALGLLRSSQYSLTEVAHICGFADQSHFIRVFKSITGHLPKEFVKF